MFSKTGPTHLSLKQEQGKHSRIPNPDITQGNKNVKHLITQTQISCFSKCNLRSLVTLGRS